MGWGWGWGWGRQVSDSKRQYVVVCDPDNHEGHNCGVFNTMNAAVKCVADDHVDTGTPLAHYSIEQWRGRQFNGAHDHTGQLIETRHGEEVGDEAHEDMSEV